jgi:hypothetical protein
MNSLLSYSTMFKIMLFLCSLDRIGMYAVAGKFLFTFYRLSCRNFIFYGLLTTLIDMSVRSLMKLGVEKNDLDLKLSDVRFDLEE